MDGKKVKEILDNYNLPIAEIARRMGDTRQNVSSKLKGSDIGLAYIKKIASVSNIPLQVFIDAADDSEKLAAEPDSSYKTEADKTKEDIEWMKAELERLRKKIEGGK